MREITVNTPFVYDRGRPEVWTITQVTSETVCFEQARREPSGRIAAYCSSMTRAAFDRMFAEGRARLLP